MTAKTMTIEGTLEKDITHDGDLSVIGADIGSNVTVEIGGKAKIDGNILSKATVNVQKNVGARFIYGTLKTNRNAEVMGIEKEGTAEGAVEAKRNITVRNDITGRATAGRNIECTNINKGGLVVAGENITVRDDITGRATAKRNIECTNINRDGLVAATENITVKNDIAGQATAKRDIECTNINKGGLVVADENINVKGYISNGIVKAGENATISGQVRDSSISAKEHVEITSPVIHNSSINAETIHLKGGVKNASIVCQKITSDEPSIENSTIAMARCIKGIPNGIFIVHNIIDSNCITAEQITEINVNDKEHLANSGLDKALITQLQTYTKERAA